MDCMNAQQVYPVNIGLERGYNFLFTPLLVFLCGFVQWLHHTPL